MLKNLDTLKNLQFQVNLKQETSSMQLSSCWFFHYDRTSIVFWVLDTFWTNNWDTCDIQWINLFIFLQRISHESNYSRKNRNNKLVIRIFARCSLFLVIIFGCFCIFIECRIEELQLAHYCFQQKRVLRFDCTKKWDM